MANKEMVDTGGHQLAHIEYPGLPAEEILEAVHRFYDEYYFRPKAVFRIVKKAFFNSEERKRLYHEAKGFLKVRANRNRWVKQQRQKQVAPPAPPVNGEPASETEPSVEPANA
jgi:hypothetical protein